MLENETNPFDEQEFNLDEAFKIIHEQDDELVPAIEEAPVKPEKHSKKEEKAAVKALDDEEQDDKEKPSDVKKEAPKKEDVDLKLAYEKLEKSARDTQKSFHENRKQLAAYKKAVEKFKEDGVLLEEEATLLLDHTRFEEPPSADENPLDRYIDVWNKELKYMRKYSKDSQEIDQSIRAFDHLMATSYEKDRQDIMDELSRYEDDEVELTNKMLEIGREYNNDIYSDIEDAGGLRNLKSSLNKKVVDLEKQLDNLQKKHDKLKLRHEDYDSDPVPLRPGTGSGNNNLPKSEKVDLGAFFDSVAQM